MPQNRSKYLDKTYTDVSEDVTLRCVPLLGRSDCCCNCVCSPFTMGIYVGYVHYEAVGETKSLQMFSMVMLRRRESSWARESAAIDQESAAQPVSSIQTCLPRACSFALETSRPQKCYNRLHKNEVQLFREQGVRQVSLKSGRASNTGPLRTRPMRVSRLTSTQ